MLRNSLLCVGLVASSTAAFSQDYDLPAGCEYGRVKSYDISSNHLKTAVEAGYDIYSDSTVTPGGYLAWGSFLNSIYNIVDGYDYLRVEAPKHVIRGTSFRAKGNLFDTYANVEFYNSEEGFVGTDKSNAEANAYLNMSFPKTYGYGLVWVARAGGMCSAEGVWVQKAPTLSSLSASFSQNGDRVVGTVTAIGGSIDKFSRYGREGKPINYLWEIRREGVVRQRAGGKKWCDVANADYAEWEVLKSGSSNKFEFDYYACPFSIRATVRDGTYSSITKYKRFLNIMGN